MPVSVAHKRPTITVVVKGWPRLSETFIAQELLALERAGLCLRIVALRHPTDQTTHPVHRDLKAPIIYLPEYLHQEPMRVLRSWWRVRRRVGYHIAWAAWWRDLGRDRTRNRIRRWGQALVLAAELPDDTDMIYAHFIHTPGSVGRYGAMIAGLPFSLSAHAKDIHTTPDWEIAEKIADCQWLSVCSAANAEKLRRLAHDPAKVNLIYHGLDLRRFDLYAPPLSERNGAYPEQPVRLLSVGRAVAKKGFDILIAALAQLPKDLNWQWHYVGGGALLSDLQQQAARAGIADNILWAGPQDQAYVLAACRDADIFVLPSRITADGDRDGLPNVLMEAASQSLCLVATPVGAIGELITDGQTGRLVPADDPDALAKTLAILMADPQMRQDLGLAAQRCLTEKFELSHCIAPLLRLFLKET